MGPTPRLAALALVLGLAACATPQQQCVARANHDLKVVDGLIAGLQRDIARGYGMQRETVTSSEFRFCGAYGSLDGPTLAGAGGMCLTDVPRVVERPVAIDLGEARHKLAALEAKRRELAASAARAIDACAAAYPQ